MEKKEDLRIRKTRANLYKTTIQLMEKQSFEEIKITDICKKAKINRSTFYDHFKDKNELLSYITEELKEKLNHDLKEMKEAKKLKDYYLELTKALLEHIQKNKKLYSALTSSQTKKNAIIQNMIADAITNITKVKIHSQNTPVSTKVIIVFYSNAIASIVTESIQENNGFESDKILETINKLIPNLN